MICTSRGEIRVVSFVARKRSGPRLGGHGVNMSHHLLIVEDDEGLREGLRRNFEFEGYRVSTAPDGHTGLAAALSLRPDLVILDIMLPRMDGFEVCRRICESENKPAVLILTVRRSAVDRAKGFEMGADDYLVKPFSLQELSRRVKVILEHRSPPAPLGGMGKR